jgi:tetratricopeptide (TPR) repeat protein
MRVSGRHRGAAGGAAAGPWATVASSPSVRVAVLALLLAVAYGAALRAGVAWDDLEILSANPAIRTLARPWTFFTDSSTIGPFTEAWLAQYRPLRTLLFALEFAVFGGAAWGYHLVSLALHALAAFAVGRLTRATFGAGGWLAAAIWLLHPALSETPLSLAAQGNALCVLLAVTAGVLHLRWIDTGSRWWLAGALGAALAAMFSYESGMAAPLLVLACDLLRRVGEGQRGWRWVLRHAPYWALLAAFVVLRQAVTAPIPHEEWWGGSWTASAALQLRVWAEGWRLTVLPAGMLIRYQPEDLPGYLSAGVAAALHVALLGLGAWALVRRRWLVPAIAVVWWYAAQAPTSNVIVPNLGYLFAPRFLFLALVIPVTAAAPFLARHLRGRPLAWCALAAVALLAVVADRRQAAIWQNTGTVFEALIEHNPRDFGAQYNLGWFELKCGHLDAAAKRFAAAKALNPEDGRPDYWLGEVALAARQRDRALEHLHKSLAIERRQVEPRVRLAEIESDAGRWDDALAWLTAIPETARGGGPRRAELDLGMARAEAGKGDCAAAREHVRAAVDLRPISAALTLAGGRVLHRCGDVDAAHELFRVAAQRAGAEYVSMVGETTAFP